MKLSASFFVLFVLFTLNLQAQMTEMLWDDHGVAFSVPSSFKETTSTGEEYTASNDNLMLSIIPIQDENLDKSHMAQATLDMAKELGYDSIEAADEAEVDDFIGYFIKGTKDGVHAVVMTLMDVESSTNLIVVIVYADGYANQAVEIAESFRAYDK